MTPPNRHRCEHCALQEARGGRVCPAAREGHGLPDVEAQRHAETLYAAVLADAQRSPGFAELVRWDAINRPAGAMSGWLGHGLLTAHLSDPATHDFVKEVVDVFSARTD
jgi:hypothetical protein